MIIQKVQFSKNRTWQVFIQLVVPQQYRKMVMKLAHESIMSAHLPIKRTIQKVLDENFWLRKTSEIKRFCQSCDICQCTLPIGKIVKDAED